jgi:tRNA (guanine37-N1)-methyltransferase
MQFDICAFGPNSMQSYLNDGLPRQLILEDRIEVRLHDYHQWAGEESLCMMTAGRKILKAEPVIQCVRHAQEANEVPGRLILFSPGGRKLDQPMAVELAESPRLILVCGRLGGFEASVYDSLRAEELSVGDYVLNSGEVAAMVLLDTVIRLIPGALGAQPKPWGPFDLGRARTYIFG